jgi:hypothetical protein
MTGFNPLKQETGLTNGLLNTLLNADHRRELNTAAPSMRVRPLAATLQGLPKKNPAENETIPHVFKWVIGITLEEAMVTEDCRVLTTVVTDV